MKSFKPKLEFSPRNVSGGGQTLRLVPLGGVGDVTKNMYAYEYGNDIIIIDCGVSFPDVEMRGVDLVIPDINYLKDKKQNIRGIVITHGHDDHYGALPFIWPELGVPIYSQKLTCGLIRAKRVALRGDSLRQEWIRGIHAAHRFGERAIGRQEEGRRSRHLLSGRRHFMSSSRCS